MSFAHASFKVGATLSAYRIVKMSAANTVNLATANTDKFIGVTADDVKETNQAIPVVISGLAKVYFNDSCAVGALVTTDNLGQGIPAVANTAGVNVLGINVGTTVNTTGTISEVLIGIYQLQAQ